jgi:hypothetical protein
MSNPITTHSRHNHSVTEYYSKKDDDGKAVYSFSRDFEDTWDQETEDEHESKNSDPWLKIEELEAKLEALQEELNDFHWSREIQSKGGVSCC